MITVGQSCETSTSTRGVEATEDAMDEREERETVREETVLDNNLETVCDVKYGEEKPYNSFVA